MTGKLFASANFAIVYMQVFKLLKIDSTVRIILLSGTQLSCIPQSYAAQALDAALLWQGGLAITITITITFICIAATIATSQNWRRYPCPLHRSLSSQCHHSCNAFLRHGNHGRWAFHLLWAMIWCVAFPKMYFIVIGGLLTLLLPETLGSKYDVF